NNAKYIKIQEIKNAGFNVKIKALFTGLSEDVALELEKKIVYQLGRKAFNEGQLTNFMPGGDWHIGDSLFYEKPISINLNFSYLDFFATQNYEKINKISNITHLSDLPFEMIFQYHHNGILFSIDTKECFFRNVFFETGLSFLNSELPIINREFIISTFDIKYIYISKFIPFFHTHLYDSEFYNLLDKKLESHINTFELISNKSNKLFASFKDNHLILTSKFSRSEQVNHFFRKDDGTLSPFKNNTLLKDPNPLRTNMVFSSKETKLSSKDIAELNRANEEWGNIQDLYWDEFIKSK